MLRINLISGPRNISTAMMYSFAQRADTKVIDEPFYGYYLKIRPTPHPGREDIIRVMETDPKKVVETLLNNTEKPVLFIKNMAHHLIEIEERFFSSVMNVFLIRNPGQLIASFAQIIPNPTMTDIAVKKQHELFTWLKNSGKPPVVLDSGELLKDPQRVLRRLCSDLHLSFDRAMLSWKPGPRPEDGVWAIHWYQTVHTSGGFARQPTSNRPLPKNLEPLHSEALPYYTEMFEDSIKA